MLATTDGISTPIVQLKNELDSQGAPLEQLATELYELKNRQREAGVYSQHRWCARGSDSSVTVASPDGEFKKCVVWGVNHYTGLNRDPRVIKAAQEAAASFGTGAGTSGMSGGMCDLHKQIEATIAERVRKPAALLFPTGYSANLGILSTLPREGDLILFDRDCHASIIDGMRMSSAKWLPFRHNDVNDLQRKLARYGNRHRDTYVVVESAYSMSGNLSPLREITALKQQHEFYLYVDEAHTFGFYGDEGGGYCRDQGVSDQVDFIMSTLSKATASIGGFFAGDERYIPLLEWCANSYIFQACIPPSDAAAVLASLDILGIDSSIAEQLHANNAYMRQALTDIGLDLGESRSPVIPVYIPDPDSLMSINRELFDNGVFSVSIVYPAVKPREGRIRFIVTARHTQEQIDYTVEQLEAVCSKYGVIG